MRIEEIKNYVPEEAPTYVTRVRRAFSSSINLLVDTAQALSILVVALFPWLAVLAVPALLVWLVVRILRCPKWPS